MIIFGVFAYATTRQSNAVSMMNDDCRYRVL
jgi:hypothetical protein